MLTHKQVARIIIYMEATKRPTESQRFWAFQLEKIMFTINSNGSISLSGNQTGLAVTQDARGTIVYTVESKFSGVSYKEHDMPHSRYSLAHNAPTSGVAGRDDFERDLLDLIGKDGFAL